MDQNLSTGLIVHHIFTRRNSSLQNWIYGNSSINMSALIYGKIHRYKTGFQLYFPLFQGNMIPRLFAELECYKKQIFVKNTYLKPRFECLSEAAKENIMSGVALVVSGS